MSSDDTPVVAVRQATAALRAGTITRALDSDDLGLLGAEARGLVEQQTEDQADDDGTREHPAETHEVASPKTRVRVFVGHPLRSLSWVCTSRKTISPTRAPRSRSRPWCAPPFPRRPPRLA